MDLRDVLNDIETTHRTLGDMSPAPFFASTRLLTTDRAVRFVHEGRLHLGAHPEFWWKIKPNEPQQVRLFPLFGIEIVDLDHDENRRKAFTQAMLSAAAAARRS